MSERRHQHGPGNRRDHHGVILLVTLVILVILSTLGYTLCVQVAARRHRDQFMIDYSIARHACASSLKYALAAMGSLQFDLVSRPNEPDFSDVFALTEPQYQKLLEQAAAAKWAADSNLVQEGLATQPPDRDSLKAAAQEEAGRKTATTEAGKKAAKKDAKKKTAKKQPKKKAARLGDVNDVNDANEYDPNNASGADALHAQIRGPYGPPWPLVTEPMELEIGSAKVKIEIEDENAKYPLGWVMIADEKLKPEVAAGWTTFCEWMGYSTEEIGLLNEGFAKIGKTKPFKTEFKQETEAVEPPAALKSKITRPPTPGALSTIARRTITRKPVTVEEQMDRQNKEYSKLLHSSIINKDLLARPSIASDTRKESALKYLGLWATRNVNINSAPRQVLEAALTLGSAADAPKMAQEIIQRRQVKPITDVNELKQAAPRYSTALDDCRTFIAVRSTIFTVRVTAISGVAKVTAIAAVAKEGDKVQQIAVISD
ncbi:MAG: type II secretion system protein GspK [Planctomycetes bacterium]|nr:type II secretion system protein GspK [Planctomycetota bacterium]